VYAKIEELQTLQTQLLLSKILEDMLRNRIMKKQEQVHRTLNIAEKDGLSIEIDRYTALGNSTAESSYQKTIREHISDTISSTRKDVSYIQRS
jgi:ribosomal protein S3AE